VTHVGVAVAIALVVWGLVGAYVVEDRVVAWYVRRCRGSGAVALGFCLGLALAVAVLGVATGVGMVAVRDAADSRAAQAWVYLPVAVLCAPFVAVLLPSGTSWTLASDLRRAGAIRAVVAASVPLLLLGVAALVLLFAGFFATFSDG
jgi:hypothetical protein